MSSVRRRQRGPREAPERRISLASHRCRDATPVWATPPPPAHLIAELVSLLDDAPSVDDPADLELLATTLLLPLDLPELPPAVHAAVVDRVEARHDALACAVLSGLAAFATGGLAQRARAAADEGTERPVAVLKHPDTRRREVLMLGIEHEDTGTR